MGARHDRRGLGVEPCVRIGLAGEALGVLPAALIDIPCAPTLSLAVVGRRLTGCGGPAVLHTGPTIARHLLVPPSAIRRPASCAPAAGTAWPPVGSARRRNASSASASSVAGHLAPRPGSRGRTPSVRGTPPARPAGRAPWSRSTRAATGLCSTASCSARAAYRASFFVTDRPSSASSDTSKRSASPPPQ